MGKIIDMIGEKHNRLTVISRADNGGTRASWYCLCDCGNTTVVIGKKIRTGHTKSCGCFRKDNTAAQGHKNKHSLGYVQNKLKENGFELLSEYRGITKQSTFKCLTCQLVFSRKMESSLYNLYGCPSCSKLNNGFMQAKTFDKNPKLKELNSKLYLIEFKDGTEHFWKIGITRRSVEQRVKKIPYNVVSYKTIDGNLFDIYQKEKTLKQENKPFRYRPIKFFNGHTECFSRPPELI